MTINELKAVIRENNINKDVKWNGDYAKDNSDVVKNAFNDTRNELKK